VITPRITRLLRVPDLQAMHRAIAATAECAGDVNSSRIQAIVVSTTGAETALRRTLECLADGPPQPRLRRDEARARRGAGRFEIVTRDGFYARLHQRLPGAPLMLSAFEREVLLTRAAENAKAAGAHPPFKLRSGLITEILAFYDELRRRDRTVADFDRLMTDRLQPSVEIDRGAERMLRQTQFLTAAFGEFERLLDSSGCIDEHTLRRLLLHSDGPPVYGRVVVTVADQAADHRGLWTADYDLLARMPGLERIDVIATENVLAAGFHQRIHDVLPGIEEERYGAAAPPPVFMIPPQKSADVAPNWHMCRDREEELAEVARLAATTDAPERTAVVFQPPLPYLYLARHVFADAELPYQAVDSLPLAAEPFAAALDLVFTFVIAEANRASTIDLLGSPHWQFPRLTGSSASVRERVAALDTLLRELKYLGGWEPLAALGGQPAATPESRGRKLRRPSAADALQAAVAAGQALRPLHEAPTASGQIHALIAFVHAHERPPDAAAPWHPRHLRARAAVMGALDSLALAHARHDDAPLTVDRLAGAVRRWVEGQTFSPRTGSSGVFLLDAAAAAYADVDELRIVGLVEHDWPERARRSIFYPAALLSQLGWPKETDRLAASRARFQDLLRVPRQRVSVSTFTLEDDAIVSPSSFLEEIESSGLPIERTALARGQRVFAHEGLFEDPPASSAVHHEPSEWLALRASRSPEDDEAYHGAAGSREPEEYAVSHVERYLECPFKYFAARVLRLDEEREDESGSSAQERGQLLHEVFEAFFAAWHDRGGRAITADQLGEALELFESVAESTLARLPEADRALERTYLLGSAVAAGLGERAFNFEIEQEVAVLERLLEHRLEGEFQFLGADGPRRLRIRAKADRIDLLADGTLRVIDYKLGRAPKTSRALQLPIYGVCAEQHLRGRHGRTWDVSRAGYVAFKEKNPFVPLGASTSLEQAFRDGEQRLVAAVGGIERGEFPVRPDEPFLCTRCGYSGVCRKDYVGDE